MTELLFRTDPYLRDAAATVEAHTPEGGIILDRSIFYPQGGGQPGDSGSLTWKTAKGEARLNIATTAKGDEGRVVLIPAEPVPMPPVGCQLKQHLDWDRRHRHMRIHTALHLLSVIIPLPVTGGSIAAEKGRLDFCMPEPPADKAALESELNALVTRDLPVTASWISAAELEANPNLVKTMSVRPPTGTGRVRLIRIGSPEAPVDLQPCGGTHVARTGEIGPIRLGKIENKGRQNRRVNLHLS